MKIDDIHLKLKRKISYGEIKFYNQQKRYGFITEFETGKEYFFMNRDAAIREENLISYLPVSFSVIDEQAADSGKNMRAILVREIKL